MTDKNESSESGGTGFEPLPSSAGDEIADLVSNLGNSPDFDKMMRDGFVRPIMEIIKNVQAKPVPLSTLLDHPGRSTETKELDAAFCKAFGQIQKAHKDADNPHHSTKYASLDACYDACREALSSNGLAIRQFTIPDNDPLVLRLVTKLVHESGQWESSLYIGRVQERRGVMVDGDPQFYTDQWGKQKPLTSWQDTNDPQAYGIFMTYMRRYQLMAMVGIAPSDDIDNQPLAKQDQNPIKKTQSKKETKSAENKSSDNSRQATPGQSTSMSPEKVAKLEHYIQKQGMTPVGIKVLFDAYKIKSLDQLRDGQFTDFTKAVLTAKKLDEAEHE